MNITIQTFHKKSYLKITLTISFHATHVSIIVTHHCGKTQRYLFKRCQYKFDVKIRLDCA